MQRIIFIKREADYGDDTLTLDTADALLVKNFNRKRLDGERKSHEFDHQGVGAQEEENVDPHTMDTFTVEAAASGVAGTAPSYGDVIEACAFDRVIDGTAGTVTYSMPATADGLRTGRGSVAIFDHDPAQKLLQRTFGCRGSLSFSANASDYPVFDIANMRGFYNTPEAAAAPVVPDAVWAAQARARAFIKEHIREMVLVLPDGAGGTETQPFCPVSFKYDWGLQTAQIATCDATEYVNYDPSLELTVKAKLLDDVNLWAFQGEKVGVRLALKDKDDTAGQRLTIQDDVVQIFIAEGEVEGARVLNITGKPIGQTAEIVFS